MPVLDGQLPDLPKEVKFCQCCVTSNQRPRITFDERGYCSACQYNEEKETGIDWDERDRELRDLLDKHRSKDGSFDVVVPSSGGKDSAYVAHVLREEYGMHPLTVTWSPFIYTDIGWQNQCNLNHSGMDNIMFTPNGLIHRKFSRLGFECNGDNFDSFVWGQKGFPFHMAVKFGIPLIFEGENGDVEYGGSMEGKNRGYQDVSDWKDLYFRGNGSDALAEVGLEYGVFEKGELNASTLQIYSNPPIEQIEEVGVEQHFFSYYRKWIPQENYYYAVENTGFEVNPVRSEGTYTKYASLDDQTDGLHFWLGYLKFGMGRTTRDASMEVRCNHITREEAVFLVRRYDGEFPKKHFKTILEYLDIEEERFFEVADKFRTPHLWEKENGEWKLKHVI